MKFRADEDLAMILPLPTKRSSGEDAVEFINLEDCPDLFEDIEKGFPTRQLGGATLSDPLSVFLSEDQLEVHDVGAFEASFVPTVADFRRLDERFRLPDGVWANVPGADKYGFAVFKLKARGQKPHPFAFVFDTASPTQAFYPTVHIHDGKVHRAAEFDHTLYYQGAAPLKMSEGFGRGNQWRESSGPARNFMETKPTEGVVLGDYHIYKRVIRGNFVNRDIRIVPQFV
ncbi:MAG: hypothetical protein AAF585_20895 [Verrucomicrobiota bacterium]